MVAAASRSRAKRLEGARSRYLNARFRKSKHPVPPNAGSIRQMRDSRPSQGSKDAPGWLTEEADRLPECGGEPTGKRLRGH